MQIDLGPDPDRLPPSPIDYSPAAQAFRAEVPDWLGEHAPEELRGVRVTRDPAPELDAALSRWAQTLTEAGNMCIGWPREYGGRGLTGVEVAILNEEFGRADIPRLNRGMGEALVRPAIIAHGTDEQKREFLSRIICGEHVYCQGFSEPGAGSDLASLRTRGVVDGDELVINGQKIWTSGFAQANMFFTLCRTNPDAPKHRGISYVLVPTGPGDQANGIEFRPITRMTGKAHFAETFFTHSRAPLGNVIGGLNNGWRVAMTTLAAAENPSELPVVATLAKATAGETYCRAAADNIQIHGGIGFTSEHDAHLYFKRAKTSQLMFGDTGAYRRRLADRIGL